MATSFYFYDLETSGFNPRDARIMQFAGQRTDMNLQPIGDPQDILIRMSDDTVPEPDAILITGITPQKTIAEGVTEAEFLRIFENDIATSDTIFVGYNTVRFDDEFMRYLHYRNFYDPYEWQWRDGRSRWDILDVVRMMRALRPEGITWPFAPDGSPSNRLELLTKVNNLEHLNAHDALSDVSATIAIARLIRNKQQALFDYLLSIRSKKEVIALTHSGQPLVYSSGRYPSEFEKTTVVIPIGEPMESRGRLVYDLRHDPAQFVDMKPEELAEAWTYKRDADASVPRVPVKLLQYNHCPAIAPIGVLDAAAQDRIKLDLKTIARHRAVLSKYPEFAKKIRESFEQMREQRQTRLVSDEVSVDAQLYDGFFVDADKTKMSVVRAADVKEVAGLDLVFKDDRLSSLLPLYRARNFPQSLTDEQRVDWERYRERKLLGGKQSSKLAKYFERLSELANQPSLSQEKQYLLEELQLYGQSIMPTPDY